MQRRQPFQKDDVQFTRRDYQHRCRLPARGHDHNAERGTRWLTLPVHLADGRATRIHDVRLVDVSQARRRTDRMLKHHFRKARHWPVLAEALQQVLEMMGRTDRLAEITQSSTNVLLALLGWAGTIVRSSDLSARAGRCERLADLTAVSGATAYLYGTGGARYLDPAPFRAHGLTTVPFGPPALGDPRVWADARSLTSLQPLMTAGPATVRAHLRRHADATRTRPPMATPAV